jgi:peptidoglycan/LPS O-acetylase OafA/YrhL
MMPRPAHKRPVAASALTSKASVPPRCCSSSWITRGSSRSSADTSVWMFFFVLSGFLTTSLLLREVERAGRPPSIRSFYARRMRRILPAATVVIVVIVVWAYASLGFIRGDQVATDARWTSAFAGNLHFALTGTDYLRSQDLPSPLQHYWSLGVEEQFYVVAVGLRHARLPVAWRPTPFGARFRARGDLPLVAGVVVLADSIERDMGVLLAADARLGACGRRAPGRRSGRR